MGRLIIRGFLLLGFAALFTFPAVSFASEKMPVDTVLLERTCTDCHDIELILEKNAYMSEWHNIVKRMMAYDSSEISQTDKLKVLKFIKENLAVDGPGGRSRQAEKTDK